MKAEIDLEPYQPLDRDLWTAKSERERDWWAYFLSVSSGDYLEPKPMNESVAELVRQLDRSPVTIADLGSGAACVLGSLVEGVDVEVVCSDALADDYADHWRNLGVRPAIPVERQDMTALTYPDESFDGVVCFNALDHDPDPFAAIREMVRVCKPGGFVLMRHIRRAATGAKYGGLHQWDIAAYYDDLCIERHVSAPVREGPKQGFLLSECVPGFTVEARHDGVGGSLYALYWKPE